MEAHHLLSDNSFEHQFARQELAPELFSHEAHLRLAWIHIQKYRLQQAEKNISLQLKSYVQSLGASDKYNLTLTLAAIKAVHHFIQRSSAEDFHGFITEFPQLNSRFRDLISSHYSFDIYQCSKAKEEYLKPDLLPF